MAVCSIFDLHRIHSKIYSGVGYHILIRKNGKVYLGRPLWAIGAHCLGYNTWIGVVVEGNFENETMNPIQRKAVENVQLWLLGLYGPNFRTKGHRELNATVCPGKKFPLATVKAITLDPLMRDLVALKKAMNKYAVKNGVRIPAEFAVNDNWGSGAKTLAWRVSSKVLNKPTAKPTLRLYSALVK
jgi:hypothetical protein